MIKQSKVFSNDSMFLFAMLFTFSGCNEKEIQTSKNLQKDGIVLSPSNSANLGPDVNTPSLSELGLADLGMANGIENDSITAHQICHFNSLVKFLSRHPHVSSDTTSKAPIASFYQGPHQDIPPFAKSFHDLIVLNMQKQNIFLKKGNGKKDPKPDDLGSENLKKEILDFTSEFLAYLEMLKNSNRIEKNAEILNFGKNQMAPDEFLSAVNALTNMVPLSSLVVTESKFTDTINPDLFLFTLAHDFKYSLDYEDRLEPVSSIQGIMEAHKGDIQYKNQEGVSSKQKNYFVIFIDRNDNVQNSGGDGKRTPFSMDLNLTVQVEKEEKSFLLQAAILHSGDNKVGHYTALTVHHDGLNQPFFLYHDDSRVTKKLINDSHMIEKLSTDSTMLLYVEK